MNTVPTPETTPKKNVANIFLWRMFTGLSIVLFIASYALCIVSTKPDLKTASIVPVGITVSIIASIFGIHSGFPAIQKSSKFFIWVELICLIGTLLFIYFVYRK